MAGRLTPAKVKSATESEALRKRLNFGKTASPAPFLSLRAGRLALWMKFRMMFSKHLRDRVRQGRIRCSVRIWTRPHVRVGGWYRMEEGHIVVDSIELISIADVTRKLARESGFDSADDLLRIARHGSGDNVYLIRFHYMPPGALDPPTWVGPS